MKQKKLNQVNDKIIKLQDEQIERLKGVVEILELRNKFLENRIQILEQRNNFLENKNSRALKWIHTERSITNK